MSLQWRQNDKLHHPVSRNSSPTQCHRVGPLTPYQTCSLALMIRLRTRVGCPATQYLLLGAREVQIEIVYRSLQEVWKRSIYTAGVMFCLCFHSCRVPVQTCESLHVPAFLGWCSRVRPSLVSSRGMLWGALGPCCWTAAWLSGRPPLEHSGESTVWWCGVDCTN